MRLLNVKTMRIEYFIAKTPIYAILSHTWGPNEATSQDFPPSRMRRKPAGWAKVEAACSMAREYKLDYIWIDTCCIDIASHAELTEAINSMFNWYRHAAVCFAYLEDIKDPPKGVTLKQHDLGRARWFTRGWTLQELIAPRNLVFFSRGWQKLGMKSDPAMRAMISKITDIDEGVLAQPERLPTVSVARRMSWASARRTYRPEDIAYCLMGIFGVNMTINYGEGTDAFRRLQTHIIQNCEDESIFAWDHKPLGALGSTGQLERGGIFAPSPQYFASASEMIPYPSRLRPYEMSNRGVHFEMPILQPRSSRSRYLGIIHCRYRNNMDGTIAIPLKVDNTVTGGFYRDLSSPLLFLDVKQAAAARPQTVYIQKF